MVIRNMMPVTRAVSPVRPPASLGRRLNEGSDGGAASACSHAGAYGIHQEGLLYAGGGRRFHPASLPPATPSTVPRVEKKSPKKRYEYPYKES